MKYLTDMKTDAVYTDNGSRNPLFEALPDLLSKEELFDRIRSCPESRSAMQRKEKLQSELMYQLSSMFIPMDYMYDIYEYIYRAIQSSYLTQNCYDSIRKANYSIYNNIAAVQKMQFCSQSECGAILGVPGIGKTSSLRRCLRTMPQIIVHQQYHEELFYCHQITYLLVECPSDCSIKTLGYNIAYAIDKAIGTNYSSTLWKFKGETVGTVALSIKQLCATYHIGAIIVDEVQNLIATNTAKKQNTRLIKFLVELMNDTSTAIIMVGTLESDTLFLKEDHLKRRTRGMRLLPMEYDSVYKKFLQSIWKYQYTEDYISLTENLMKLIYTASSGITSYIVKIFIEAQAKAIAYGVKSINAKIIRETIAVLSIIKTEIYTSGISISHFAAIENINDSYDKIEEFDIAIPQKRGRRAQKRDEKDILSILKGVSDLEICEKILIEQGIVEVIV